MQGPAIGYTILRRSRKDRILPVSMKKPPPKTPIAFKAAFEERLRTKARANGLNFQRLQALFAMGRFVARLQYLHHGKILIKGGYAMEIRLQNAEVRARTTRDLDITCQLPADRGLELLRQVGEVELQDFLSYDVTEDRELVCEGNEYGGTRYRVECSLAGRTYQIFKLDVAFGEPISGAQSVQSPFLTEWLEELDIPVTIHPLISVEQHLAEKLHAYTIPRDSTNSRVRDLPDMGLLLVEPIEANLLSKRLADLFGRRNTHPPPQSLQDHPAEWAEPYLKLLQQDPHLNWASLADLYERLQAFWNPFLAGQCAHHRWDPKSWAWIPPPTVDENKTTSDP